MSYPKQDGGTADGMPQQPPVAMQPMPAGKNSLLLYYLTYVLLVKQTKYFKETKNKADADYSGKMKGRFK